MQLFRFLCIISIFSSGIFLTDDKTQYLYHIQQLIYCMIANGVLYILYHLLLLRYSNTYPFLNYNQRSYVIKNLSKSTILAYISSHIYLIFSTIILDKWNNSTTTYLGNLYISTDIMGLIFVPSLSADTVRHHFVVCFLGLINNICNYENPGIHRAMVILTIFSTFPYTVNTSLGIRHLKLKYEYFVSWLLRLSMALYIACIFSNFIYQLSYVIFTASFSITQQLTGDNPDSYKLIIYDLLFLSCYYVILLDDISLVQYFEYKTNTHVWFISPLFNIIRKRNENNNTSNNIQDQTLFWRSEKIKDETAIIKE